MTSHRPGSLSRSKAVRHGAAWEAQLSALHALYREQGRAIVLRSPAPMRVIRGARHGGMVQAVHTAAGPADYTGLVVVHKVAVPIALEAKSTTAKRWPLSSIAPHQAALLCEWWLAGGIAAVLLRVGPLARDAWVLPWAQVGSWWAESHSRVVALGTPASLGPSDCDRLGRRFDPTDGWLRTLLALHDLGRTSKPSYDVTLPRRMMP